MSYATRNAILLAIIAIMVSILGYSYVFVRQGKKLEKQLAMNEQKQKRLEELEELDKDRSELLNYLEHLKELSLGKIGTIVGNETPGETFDYILREINSASLDVNIDLVFEQEMPFASLKARQYDISGIAPFKDVYDFIWFLESGPIFYNITNLGISRLDTGKEEDVVKEIDSQFNLTVRSFIRDEGPGIEEIKRTKGSPENIENLVTNKVRTVIDQTQNFKERVSGEKSGGSGGGAGSDSTRNKKLLPEMTDDIELLALTNDAIVLRNGANNIKVRKGEDFYGAFLKKVNIHEGQAIFQMNGRAQTIVLSTTRN